MKIKNKRYNIYNKISKLLYNYKDLEVNFFNKKFSYKTK